MSKVLICILSLALADFGFEYFKEVPNFIEVGKITLNQFWALVIYHFVWEV